MAVTCCSWPGRRPPQHDNHVTAMLCMCRTWTPSISTYRPRLPMLSGFRIARCIMRPDTGWTVIGRPACTEQAVSVAATAQVHIVLATSKIHECRLGHEPGPKHKATRGRGLTMLEPFHVIARFCSSGVGRSVQNAFGLSVPGSYSSLHPSDSALRSGFLRIQQANKTESPVAAL